MYFFNFSTSWSGGLLYVINCFLIFLTTHDSGWNGRFYRFYWNFPLFDNLIKGQSGQFDRLTYKTNQLPSSTFSNFYRLNLRGVGVIISVFLKFVKFIFRKKLSFTFFNRIKSYFWTFMTVKDSSVFTCISLYLIGIRKVNFREISYFSCFRKS